MTDGTPDREEVPEMRSRIGLAILFFTPVIYTVTVMLLTTGSVLPAVERRAPASPVAVASAMEQGPASVVAVPPVSPEQLAALTEATTWTTVPGIVLDTERDAGTDGLVIHNPDAIPVFDSPGGKPVARLPVRQGASSTWLPVIASQPGWLRVLLPSRPNGSTGWISAIGIQVARNPFEIRTRLAAMTLDLLRDGQVIGTWRTSPGKADTPSPVGRTFVLAAIRDAQQTYSPVIMPLGAHSETLSSFGSGPGTVALHTWPTDTVMGTAASHGCIRVPDAAMAALLQVPAGTVIRITP